MNTKSISLKPKPPSRTRLGIEPVKQLKNQAETKIYIKNDGIVDQVLRISSPADNNSLDIEYTNGEKPFSRYRY